MNKTKKFMPASKLARLAMFAAAAIIFSYVEAVIPFDLFGIFGFKLGLSNIAVIWVIYSFSLTDALAVALIKSLAVSMAFTGITGFAFSALGGVFSVLVMWLLKKCKRTSIYGVSVAGATAHNIGQLCVAAFAVSSFAVAAYLPILMICSVFCGIFMAAASAAVVKLSNKNQYN